MITTFKLTLTVTYLAGSIPMSDLFLVVSFLK